MPVAWLPEFRLGLRSASCSLLPMFPSSVKAVHLRIGLGTSLLLGGIWKVCARGEVGGGLYFGPPLFLCKFNGSLLLGPWPDIKLNNINSSEANDNYFYFANTAAIFVFNS